MGFANPPSTTESVRMKKKKSHKAKHTDELPSTASINGLASSPSPEDDVSRPSKRKRDSESHKKKNNKKRREGEDDANEESTLQDTNQMSDEEVDRLPSKETREMEQNGTGEASLLQGSPEPTSGATPGDSLLKKVRGYRIGGKNQQKVGFFIEEEVKALENFKVQFCNIHGVEGRTFDAMIQHSERGGDEWPVGTHICTKTDFWNDIYALIPDRDRRSVYRFMRRHFQDTTQKAHDWTAEQDEELIRLHAQHGPKYAHIAKLLGRSDDDVTQRWKNRLQHRDTKRTGAWSEDELRAFMTSLEEYRNLLITSSAEPEKAGKDIWEMDLKSISWGSISNGMGNSRTRQQCADKWRKISKNIVTLRQTIDPNAVFDPVEAAKKHHRWNGVAESEKSNVYVEGDDDDDEDEDEETRVPSTTPAIIPKLEFAAEQQAVDLARVAREASVESSPSRGDIQVDGSYSVGKTKKRKHADAEESDDDEDDDDAAPSSPISENPHSEVKESREDKQERKRKKREKKERKRREAAEAAAAAEGVEEGAPITPKEKKHKKHRKSEANGTEVNEAEPTESSKKKSKKEKKKHKKAAQEEGAGVDYTSDIESSMVV